MNLDIYNDVRAVPEEAKKEIRGGRLNGKTDINPMWRIKKLTEQFGPCGIGWKYTIDREWLETGANGEISAFTTLKYPNLTAFVSGASLSDCDYLRVVIGLGRKGVI